MKNLFLFLLRGIDDRTGSAAILPLLLAALIALPVLGWLCMQAQLHGLIGLRSGSALFVVGSVVVFGVMILHTSGVLRELDAKRKLAEESLLRSNRELEILIEMRTNALRHLSTRLMRLQDEERRRISRELHDSLGQYLAGLGIHLDLMAQRPANFATSLMECRELLQRTIVEMRTLSHLLHPPLLEEIGFASAAKLYIEEFAKRSGVEATADLPSRLPRLPERIEIALFRILQEGLTNIHRHSGSLKAEISIQIADGQVCLDIRDRGKGIDADVLKQWQTSGAGGVGLTSMRERAKELGGHMELTNPGGDIDAGALVRVVIPVGLEVTSKFESQTSLSAAVQ